MALQILFQAEFSSAHWNARQAFEVYANHFEVAADISEFAWTLVDGVWNNKRELDSLIETHSPHWHVSRMAFVDKNILRMATFELSHLHEKVPPKVAIDEAIEIAKRYGSQESSAFVNGVLDNIAKSLPQLRGGLAG